MCDVLNQKNKTKYNNVSNHSSDPSRFECVHTDPNYANVHTIKP